MKSFYKSKNWLLALLLGCAIGIQVAHAQFTVVTSPPLIANNGQSGVTFELSTVAPIIITGFSNTFNSGAQTAEIWYRIGGVQHSPGLAPNISTANGWIMLANNITVVGNNTTPVPIPGNFSLNIPANTDVGFFIGGGMRYQTHTGPPDQFSDANITIKTGTNFGYGGTFPTPAFHPRQFLGSVTYEFALPCTAPPIAGNATAAATDVCINNTTVLSLSNNTSGLGQTFQWQRSLDNSTWTNIPGATTLNYSAVITDTAWYRCEVTCNNQSATSTSVKVNAVGGALSGTYTINQFMLPSATNFVSFQDFFDAMECGGISGPVVVNVAAGSGPYIERVEAIAVAGVSATNTITINGNGNTLTYAATGINDIATLTLDGIQFLTVDNLYIEANGTTHGWAVHLINGADNNTIRNCSIMSSTTITSANSAGIVASNMTTFVTLTGFGNNANHLTIENNVIVGGSVGIALNGPGLNNNAIGNVILNNTILDQHAHGINARAQSNCLIFGNEISRPNRTVTGIYRGIAAGSGMANSRIENNRIHSTHNNIPNNTSSIFGIDLSTNTTSMSAAEPLIVANNQIYNINGNGMLQAIFMSNNNHVMVLHNTINIDVPNSGATATTRLFNTTSIADNCVFQNNIMYLNRGGSGQQHMVFVNTPASAIQINNNVYYAEELGTNPNVNVGFHVSNHRTFNDWQTANNGAYEQNGTYFNPTFLGGTVSDFLRPTTGAIKNIGANFQSLVPVDYDSVPRPTNPDPGAYQFNPLPCSGAFEFSVDSLFPGGAILSWQSVSPVNEWQIEWDTCGFVPGSAIGNLDSAVSNSSNYILNMPMGQCFCVYVREKCPSGGFGPWTGPLEICVPIEFDAELVSLVNPEDLSCGDSLMPITVEIRNNGFFPITSMPITANITGDLTQSLSITYTGNLLENEVDTVVVGTVNLYNGGYINVETYTSLANDQFVGNDTLRKDSLLVIPFQPLITSAEYCPGETDVTIRALPMSSARYEWFTSATGGTPIGTGDSIVVPVSSGTLYVGYMDNQDSLNTIQQGGSGCGAGNMFDIIPNSTLDITGFTVRPFGTQANMPISVWIVTGGYQGTTQASWTLVESGVIPNAILNTPVRYDLTNPLTVNANTTYGIYLQFNASYTVGANTYSNSDMTLIAGIGLCAPFDYCCDPRTWNGAIHYGTSACSDIRTPVTPTASDSVQANFTWNTISHTVSFQNTSLNADSVVWFFDTLGTAAGDSVTFQFPQTDSFEVCMIAHNSCGSDTICQMVWAENISVERFGEMLNLRLFPNPNNGTFTLSFLQHLKGDLRVEIIDLSGRVLLNQLYTNHQGAFENIYDLNHLASGMYQLRLSSPDGTTMRSFVISR